MRKFEALAKLEEEIAEKSREKRRLENDLNLHNLPGSLDAALADYAAKDALLEAQPVPNWLQEHDLWELARRTGSCYRDAPAAGGGRARADEDARARGYWDESGLYWLLDEDGEVNEDDTFDLSVAKRPRRPERAAQPAPADSTSTEGSDGEYEVEADLSSASDAEECAARPRARKRPPPLPVARQHAIAAVGPARGGPKPKAYQPKVVDKDAPSFTKHPSGAIPATWAHLVDNPFSRGEADEEKGPEPVWVADILADAPAWTGQLRGGTVHGILMRPPIGARASADSVAARMAPLLPAVMPHGYLFVWSEREHMAALIRAFDRHCGFKYVENLCWVWRELGGRILHHRHAAPLLARSKLTLLILRRDPDNRVKLRHQRNADCVFDVVRISEHSGDALNTPDARVYDVIETLIDGSAFAHQHRPHLLHLWANAAPEDLISLQYRRRWLRVVEEDAQL